jgi:inner membrane protein
MYYFLLALVIGAIEKTWFDSRNITSIFLWAYASHLILDMLAIQGATLLYPFKKNPSVIPGNPKFRLRSLYFKTESLAFVLFIMLAYSCKDQFANGFWSMYDKVMGTLKSVHTERMLTDKAIEVKYHFMRDGQSWQRRGC